MRSKSISHRKYFVEGIIFGLIALTLKILIHEPVKLVDKFYAVALILTIVLTAGETLDIRPLVPEPRIVDFVIGFLIPLDFYAILVLLGLPLPP